MPLPSRHPRKVRTGLALALCAALLLAACSDEPQRERRMQTVKLLPDTPPPPPPKPPEEQRPDPPKQDKQEAPENKPELDQVLLRSDEAAGDGPGSGLVAGAVTREYSDQATSQEVRIAGSGDDAAARLVAQSFATDTTRALNDFLAREQALKQGDFRAQVNLWLAPSGAVQRAELVGSTGDLELDRALRDSLARFPGTASPPDALRQPLRLRVTNRMLG
jgi:protein TonB